MLVSDLLNWDEYILKVQGMLKMLGQSKIEITEKIQNDSGENYEAFSGASINTTITQQKYKGCSIIIDKFIGKEVIVPDIVTTIEMYGCDVETLTYMRNADRALLGLASKHVKLLHTTDNVLVVTGKSGRVDKHIIEPMNEFNTAVVNLSDYKWYTVSKEKFIIKGDVIKISDLSKEVQEFIMDKARKVSGNKQDICVSVTKKLGSQELLVQIHCNSRKYILEVGDITPKYIADKLIKDFTENTAYRVNTLGEYIIKEGSQSSKCL